MTSILKDRMNVINKIDGMINTYGECNGDLERGKISIEVWNSIILSVANPLIEF